MRFAHGSGEENRPRPTFVNKVTSFSQITEMQKANPDIDTEPFLITYVITRAIVWVIVVSALITGCTVADQIGQDMVQRTCIQEGRSWETVRGADDVMGCADD